MIMFSPESLEAQKLISVSIGKINASRINRTGTSLHKSLLVASVLHKARNVYLDEERDRASRYPQCPSSELTVTPVCPMNINTHDLMSDEKENRLSCSREDEVAVPERVGEESRLPLGEANTGNNVTHTTTTTTTVTSLTNTTTITTTSSSQSGGRKRRRISDQETAAAISSILPKRLRSELKEESLKCSKISHEYNNNSLESSKCSQVFVELKPVAISAEATSRLSPPTKETHSHNDDDNNEQLEYTTLRSSSEIATLSSSSEEDLSISSDLDDSSTREEESPPPEETSTSSEDSDDSDSDDSSGSSSSDSSTCEEMEVDKLTSLVSYFGGFAQPQNQSDYRIVPLHSQSGQHVVALTA